VTCDLGLYDGDRGEIARETEADYSPPSLSSESLVEGAAGV
jgi:hypothetical protein